MLNYQRVANISIFIMVSYHSTWAIPGLGLVNWLEFGCQNMPKSVYCDPKIQKSSNTHSHYGIYIIVC